MDQPTIAYLSSGVPIVSPTVGAGVAYFNQRADMTCDPGHGAPHTAAAVVHLPTASHPVQSFVAGNAPAYLDHVRTMGANDLDIPLSRLSLR